ncbi:GSCFA domain-containing protein [Christiangramia fulva]|uniref:GSCFA domain-containing protein n=1 Tax=Christiangramia fulva TaxID=2126553 RepID=A0A2R3Z520_9FLAO|nr:GSCFA domain-containing protein [Christiangramia fulva]AVR45361.1 GSCFA domain-containing protein [Christiangramia fulva]
MEFRTKVPVQNGFPKISHSSGIFLMGSCFVENIGSKLEWFRYKNLQNPTGIIFHPAPIARFLNRISQEKEFKRENILEFNGRWISLEAHSRMNRKTEKECLSDLNASLEHSRNFIGRASHVIISLGTAWGYRHENYEGIVANCHKIPQKEFIKELFSIGEIEQALKVIATSLFQINKSASILFTVSPVRHLKDGMIENQRGKANLLSGLHNFLEKEDDPRLHYFPSYEVLMDELRDYRFYTSDMLHPNETAIDYIWKIFSEAWIDIESLELNPKIDAVQKALSHRFREENSDSYKKILTKIQAKIAEIQEKHPEITFSEPL